MPTIYLTSNHSLGLRGPQTDFSVEYSTAIFSRSQYFIYIQYSTGEKVLKYTPQTDDEKEDNWHSDVYYIVCFLSGQQVGSQKL